jgi:hypothetical protein
MNLYVNFVFYNLSLCVDFNLVTRLHSLSLRKHSFLALIGMKLDFVHNVIGVMTV